MDMRIAVWVLGAFIVGAVLGANTPASAQAPQPTRYLVADYSNKYGSYTSHLYWSQVDEQTECWITETSWSAYHGGGQGGGISCLRKEPRP